MQQLVVALAAALLPFISAEDDSFSSYLKESGKSYESSAEFQMRKSLFHEREAKVEALNSRPRALWKAGINAFSDATPEELKRMLGYRRMHGDISSGFHTHGENSAFGQAAAGFESFNLALNEDQSSAVSEMREKEGVDWRRQKPSVVTPVKTQGGCGSCWAFAAAEAIETHLALQTGFLLSLSPQQMNSCAPNPQECGGSGGCSGSTPQLAYNYTIEAGGIADIWHYPYLSGLTFKTYRCRSKDMMPRFAASIAGFVQLPKNDGNAVAKALAEKGPVSIAVASDEWYPYTSGIFDSCDKDAPDINHAVVLMGFGISNVTRYWLVRNSWGPFWGEGGYIRLRRYSKEPCGKDPNPLVGFGCKVGGPKEVIACGECGVLADASYPIGATVGGLKKIQPTRNDTNATKAKSTEHIPFPSLGKPSHSGNGRQLSEDSYGLWV